MPTRFKVLAVAAALAVTTSSAAMAQYACAPGYTYYNGACQPVQSPGYGNPVSGEAAGAAQGAQTGGPVGAVVGGALGTAGGVLQGTGNMLSGSSTPPPTPACNAGYYYYNGYCYPRR